MSKEPIYIVALSGKRFTEKDTFADTLVEHAKTLGMALPKGAFAAECKLAFVEEERGGLAGYNRVVESSL